MKSRFFSLFFVLTSHTLYSQYLNVTSGVYISYSNDIQPIYQSKPVFGVNHGSNVLFGLSYCKATKKRLYHYGIDLYKGGLNMSWPDTFSAELVTEPGIILNGYFMIGKNLLPVDKRCYFMPCIGIGLQANHYKAKADAFFPSRIGDYYTIDVHHELFNRLQLAPQASLQFGIKIQRKINFGMNWKFIYTSKKIERFTYKYYNVSSPDPTLERTAVIQTTGTGLIVGFVIGIPLIRSENMTERYF